MATETDAKFLEELNREIGPMLIAESETYEHSNFFKVRLIDTPMLNSCLLNVSKEFTATVSRIGEKHFGSKPMFNNTDTTWWF